MTATVLASASSVCKYQVLLHAQLSLMYDGLPEPPVLKLSPL